MSSSSQGDEARRALANSIETAVFARRLQGDAIMPLTLDFDAWKDVIAALRAEPVRAVEEMKERCLKAAVGASYGPPSSWPGDYPKGWRHPPMWDEDQTPTPHEAAWHDNGARDAWFAIRALPIQPAEKGDPT